MSERVPRRLAAHDVQITVEYADAALEHELTDQGGGQTQSGSPWVQARPSCAVLVCDQEELVSQHGATPLKHIDRPTGNRPYRTH
jgi:hypothetical protein